MPTLLALVLPLLAHAAPDPAALHAAWSRDAATIAADSASIPTALTSRDLDALAAGDVVAHRVDSDRGAFAVGATWVDAPIEGPWICVQDARDRPLSTSVRNEWLPGETHTRRLVYMDLALPWPIADRQWVSDLHANRVLFDGTDGRVWQRAWRVADRTLAPDPDPKAVWMTTNTGAWTLLPAAGGTLVLFSVRALLGGDIPAFLSQVGAVARLKGTLRMLSEYTATVAAHYGPAHHPVYAPDGRRILPGLVLDGASPESRADDPHGTN